jgi:hypothetical protein
VTTARKKINISPKSKPITEIPAPQHQVSRQTIIFVLFILLLQIAHLKHWFETEKECSHKKEKQHPSEAAKEKTNQAYIQRANPDFAHFVQAQNCICAALVDYVDQFLVSGLNIWN